LKIITNSLEIDNIPFSKNHQFSLSISISCENLDCTIWLFLNSKASPFISFFLPKPNIILIQIHSKQLLFVFWINKERLKVSVYKNFVFLDCFWVFKHIFKSIILKSFVHFRVLNKVIENFQIIQFFLFWKSVFKVFKRKRNTFTVKWIILVKG